MSWSLALSPLIPWQLVAAIGAVVVALVIPGVLRGARGGWYRLAAAVALLLALINPILLDEERQPEPTVVALVVDKSGSQTLDGRDTQTAAAAADLQQRLAAFKNVQVRTVEAGGPQAGSPPVDGTQLFGPLQTALADVPPDQVGAVIMLTDGQVNDVPASRAALPPGAPLHVLLSGHDGERQRRIVIDAAPSFGIVSDHQTIKYRVIDDGAPSNAAIHVTVTRDGDPLSIETVFSGEPAELTVTLTHEGANVFELKADPLPGQLTPIPNSAAAQIQGIRQNLRVLLISGAPNPGERTWRDLLKSDPSVDLLHFTILRPGDKDKADSTPLNQISLIAFPTRELFVDKLSQFDLIIFDRYANFGDILPLQYFDNIVKYVQNGGAVLVAAGPDYADRGGLYDTPLAKVLSAAPTGKVLSEPYKAEVTDLGLQHPVTRGLPGAGSGSMPPSWSDFFRQIEVAPPSSGNVVMKGVANDPLLILDHEGMGRVGLLLTDDMWLWARDYQGGGPDSELLKRVVHWLMKEPALEEEALRGSARGDQLTIERQTLADATTPVTLTSPSGVAQTINLTLAEPGLWNATITAGEIGLYHLHEDGQNALVRVGPADPQEFANVLSTAGQALAAGRGNRRPHRPHQRRVGQARPAGDRAGAFVRLPVGPWIGIGIRQTEATTLTGVNRIPLFYGFLGAFGIAGLFGLIAMIGLALRHLDSRRPLRQPAALVENPGSLVSAFSTEQTVSSGATRYTGAWTALAGKSLKWLAGGWVGRGERWRRKPPVFLGASLSSRGRAPR